MFLTFSYHRTAPARADALQRCWMQKADAFLGVGSLYFPDHPTDSTSGCAAEVSDAPALLVVAPRRVPVAAAIIAPRGVAIPSAGPRSSRETRTRNAVQNFDHSCQHITRVRLYRHRFLKIYRFSWGYPVPTSCAGGRMTAHRRSVSARPRAPLGAGRGPP